MPLFAKKLFWYLQKPTLYPELVRHAFNKARRVFLGIDPLIEVREQAEAWCAPQAVDTSRAIELITNATSFQPLSSQYAEIFNRSEAIAESCPVKMGGAGDLDLLYQLSEYCRAVRVIETGVAYGWSSLALLLSLKKRDGMLVSTDLPYPGLDNDRYVGCVVPDELRKNWKMLRGPDRQRVPEAIKLVKTLDLCHYDSDKSYSGRMWTYPRLWEALRPGGLFISDDIGDNMGFADFARTIAVEPVVVRSGDKYVGVLVKP